MLNFKSFLTEEQAGYLYISSPWPLEKWLEELERQKDWMDVISASRQPVRKDVSSHMSNYQYKIDGRNLHILDVHNRNDVNKAYEFTKSTQSVKDAEYLKANIASSEWIAKSIAKDPRSPFSGYIQYMENYKTKAPMRMGYVYISTKWMLSNKHLVVLDGGNASFAHPFKPSDTPEVPSWVLSELQRYTENAMVKLNSSVREWLKTNIKLPYSSISLYRGVGSNLGYENWDIKDFNDSHIPTINKRLFSRFGVKTLDQLRVGATIDVKRGKESSWSTNPYVARVFSAGMASKTVNLMLQTTVSASDVLVDFKALPEKYKDSFKYIHQDEVIVDTNKTSAKVSNITVDRQLLAKLPDLGYKFVPQQGIFKI